MPNTAGPIIFQTSSPTSSPTSRRPSILVWLIILVIIIAISYGLMLFLRPKNNPLTANLVTTPLSVSKGQISLKYSTTTIKVGSPVKLDVQVYTGGRTVQGVDLLLTYDPQALSLNPTNFFNQGSIFSEYPVVSVDPTKGQIRISGIASLSKIGFNGIGSFGSLSFIAQKPGTTRLIVNYDANQTTDSNMIEYGSGQDVLGKGFELNLNINQ